MLQDDEADVAKWPADYRTPSNKEKARQAWLAGGKDRQFWWYYCLDPEDEHYLNTFVERRAIDGRLMYWLAALHGVNGMLYYSVNNEWSQNCGECFTSPYAGHTPSPACKAGCGAPGCPTLRDCQTADSLRINNTARTLWNPVSFERYAVSVTLTPWSCDNTIQYHGLIPWYCQSLSHHCYVHCCVRR